LVLASDSGFRLRRFIELNTLTLSAILRRTLVDRLRLWVRLTVSGASRSPVSTKPERPRWGSADNGATGCGDALSASTSGDMDSDELSTGMEL